MKLYLNGPCMFKQNLKTQSGLDYSTHINSSLKSSDLVEGEVYIMNLKIGLKINTHNCKYVVKNGKLCIHLSSFWEEPISNNDLDVRNYKENDLNPEYADLVCFYKINTKDFIDSGLYYDDIISLN